MRIHGGEKLAVLIGVDEQRSRIQIVVAAVRIFVHDGEQEFGSIELNESRGVATAAVGDHRRHKRIPQQQERVVAIPVRLVVDPERNRRDQPLIVGHPIPRNADEFAVLIGVGDEHHAFRAQGDSDRVFSTGKPKLPRANPVRVNRLLVVLRLRKRNVLRNARSKRERL